MPGAESMDWPEGTTLPLVCGGGVGYGRKGGTAVLHHRRYPLLIAAFYSFHNKLWNGVGRFCPKPCRGKCEVTLHCPSLAQQVRARPGRLPGAAQRDQARRHRRRRGPPRQVEEGRAVHLPRQVHGAVAVPAYAAVDALRAQGSGVCVGGCAVIAWCGEVQYALFNRLPTLSLLQGGRHGASVF